jgi:hypothetical protein
MVSLCHLHPRRAIHDKEEVGNAEFLSMLAIKNKVYVQIDQPPNVKRRKVVDESHTSSDAPTCGDATSSRSFLPADSVARISSGDLVGSRMDFSALTAREKDLLQKEKDLKRRSDMLDERILKVSQMEEEKCLLISQLEGRAHEAILAQLENFFTCSLCYEIM